MSRPLLLDLYCGAGGAAMGYHRAGFDVVGVDINPQPNYPFEFIQGDALDALRHTPVGQLVQAIHASPPCQRYTSFARGCNNNEDDHPDLVAPTRELLEQSGVPWVIENVVGAPLINPITLCGEMFGLGVIRHRLFESSIFLWQPEHIRHRGRVNGYRHGKCYFDAPYVAVYGLGGGKGTLEDWQRAMGIDWMSKKQLCQAIPPAYTEYIGQQLIEAREVAA